MSGNLLHPNSTTNAFSFLAETEYLNEGGQQATRKAVEGGYDI